VSRFTRTGWHRIPTPAAMLRQTPDMRCYQKETPLDNGHLSVLVGEEPGIGWHLSISHRRNEDNTPGRYPTWDEIRDARYEFCPKEATMAMLPPPKDEYVNVHDTTFHLHQIEGES
jgi:hypothetical protein